jgi:hypothetical protein
MDFFGSLRADLSRLSGSGGEQAREGPLCHLCTERHLVPPGIYLLIAHDQPVLAVITGFVWLAGAALFCAMLVRFALAKSRS